MCVRAGGSFVSRVCAQRMPTLKSSRQPSANRKAVKKSSGSNRRRRKTRQAEAQSSADIELVAKFAEALGTASGRRRPRKGRAGLSQAIDQGCAPITGALDVMPGARLAGTNDRDVQPDAACLAVHRRRRIQVMWRGAASWCLAAAVTGTFVAGMALVVLSHAPGPERAIVKTASAKQL